MTDQPAGLPPHQLGDVVGADGAAELVEEVKCPPRERYERRALMRCAECIDHDIGRIPSAIELRKRDTSDESAARMCGDEKTLRMDTTGNQLCELGGVLLHGSERVVFVAVDGRWRDQRGVEIF